jgi:3-hydroxyisobutyrate dehydrogenase-like beta-hydroxyacid dehydrogenase
MKLQHMGMVGYGEVGKIFTAGLKTSVLSVGAWDIKFDADTASAALRAAELAHATQAGVLACPSMQVLCERSDFVISAVTASNTLAVAREAAKHIRPSTIFLDLNSASPGTKQQAAQIMEAAGAHYVEAGVMTSVPPYGIRVPMLLGGAQALALAEILRAFGMNAKPVATEIGVASAIKMCRSVMIKGLEALVIESYTTARQYGVEDHMIPTLAETFPSIDWDKQGAYFFSRVAQHGKRRAEEMREATNTVREAGFEPWMAAAIAEKHEWVAQQSRAGVFDDLPKDASWQQFADRLIALQTAKVQPG